MKKLFALVLSVIMLLSVFVFTANAADNEWTVYAGIKSYKEEYETESDKPKEPGLRYTDQGVQMYTATTEQLDTMGSNAWGNLQMKEKQSYKNGFTMTAVIDKYTEKNDDKWIAFYVWNQEKCTPGEPAGKGWFCLARPSGSSVTVQSFINVATRLVASPVIQVNIYEQEALILDIRKEDGKYNIYVNDQNMNASSIFNDMEDDSAYIGIIGHQANHDEIAITITDVNGQKPTGTEAIEPFLDADAKPRVAREVEEGQPCYLWNSTFVKRGEPGPGMTSIANDDGSLHITFTGETAPWINERVKEYLYKAEDFPIFAVLYKNLDEIGNASSMLWYCSGEIYGANEIAKTPISWLDGDYDESQENPWMLLVVDLSYEDNWFDDINGFRLDIAGDDSLAGEEADIMWIGFFRNEKDAYYYAGMNDLYDKAHPAAPATTEAPAQPVETNAPASEPAEETNAPDEGTKAPAETKAPATNPGEQKSNTGLIIGIIVGVVVVAAVVVVIIVMSKKKK